MLKLLTKLKYYHWFMMLGVLGLVIAQVELDLKLPAYISEVTNFAQAGNTGEIYKLVMPMILIALFSILSTILSSTLMAKIGTDLSANVRNDLYKKVGSFSKQEITEFSTASLITRTTNDVQNVQMGLVMTVRLGISAPLMAVRGLLKVNQMGHEFLTLIGISVLAMIIILGVIMGIVMPKFMIMQPEIDQLNGRIRENLLGLRVVKAFNASKFHESRSHTANDKLTKTYKVIGRGMSFLMPSINTIVNLVSISVFWLAGSLLYHKGNIMAVGQVPEVMQYGLMILQSFIMIVMLMIFLPRAIVSAKRINEVLSKSASIIYPAKGIALDTKTLSIEFKAVGFKYPNAQSSVLEDINLSVKDGETIAFLGSTGSGKSTLVNLVPRFFDTTQGEILINGEDVKRYDQETLSSLIGYVGEAGKLFKGSIYNNLKFSKNNATEDQMHEALNHAQAGEFVSKLENGLSYELTQGGNNLSGGQKQRIAIARALIKKPKILIFDDSFSALDYKTDATLRATLKQYYKDSIKLIVAQRIATIMRADQIVILDKGKVVSVGKHEDLMKTSKIYQEMAYSQLSEEELTHEA